MCRSAVSTAVARVPASDSIADLSAAGLALLGDVDLRQAALSNWMQLNAVLRNATPELTLRLLDLEIRAVQPRYQILMRLYGKLMKEKRERDIGLLMQLTREQWCNTPQLARRVGRFLSGLNADDEIPNGDDDG